MRLDPLKQVRTVALIHSAGGGVLLLVGARPQQGIWGLSVWRYPCLQLALLTMFLPGAHIMNTSQGKWEACLRRVSICACLMGVHLQTLCTRLNVHVCSCAHHSGTVELVGCVAWIGIRGIDMYMMSLEDVHVSLLTFNALTVTIYCCIKDFSQSKRFVKGKSMEHEKAKSRGLRLLLFLIRQWLVTRETQSDSQNDTKQAASGRIALSGAKWKKINER